jgi:regulator of protease activity HflC (stomatin/prohibitin superfamily)
MSNSLIKLIIGLVALFSFVILGSCSLERVTPGHVGVRVNNWGSQSGVSPTPLNVGWYFTPPGSNIYEYPIFTSTHVWKGEENFKFQDKNGMPISADVAVAYLADGHKAPQLYQKYRIGMDAMLEGPVNRTLRNAVIAEANTLTVEQIYGDHKAILIEKARIRANNYLNQFGLQIEQLTWDSNINLPKNVQEQIAARVQNEQQAIAVQAKVKIAEASANQARAQAQGEADAAIIRAKGKAEATRLEGEALKESPQSLEMARIKQWNGSVPQYINSTGQVPIFGGQLGNR